MEWKQLFTIISFVLLAMPTAAFADSGNQAPVIIGTGGQTSISIGQLGTWSVIAHDPEGAQLTYSVSWGDSSAGASSTVSGFFQHAYSQPGAYTITLGVADPSGASAQTTKSVTVSGTQTNQAPSIVKFEGPIVTENTLAPNVQKDLHFFAYDPEGSQLTYLVNWGDGSSPSQIGPTNLGGIIMSHTYASAGIYMIIGQVSDSSGLSTQHTAQVTVVAPAQNQPPFIDGISSPTSPIAGHQETWILTAHDPENSPIRADVNWGDGSTSANTSTSTRMAFPHTYSQAGTYAIRFTVTDDKGASMQQTITTTVSSPPTNLPPVVTGVGGPTSINAGETGTWSVSAYDPDGTYLSYGVNWGDSGASPSAPVAMGSTGTFQHTYAAAGTYTITFTVADSAGASTQSSITTTVTQAQAGLTMTTWAEPDVRGVSYGLYAKPLDGGAVPSPSSIKVTGIVTTPKGETLTTVMGLVGQSSQYANQGVYGWGFDNSMPCGTYSYNVKADKLVSTSRTGSSVEKTGTFVLSSPYCLSPANQPPVITGVKAPVSLSVNEVGKWYVSAYDPDGTYLSYSVNWGDSGISPSAPASAGSTATFEHSYAQAGTYTVTFTVTDDKGATAQSASSVVVGSGSGSSLQIVRVWQQDESFEPAHMLYAEVKNGNEVANLNNVKVAVQITGPNGNTESYDVGYHTPGTAYSYNDYYGFGFSSGSQCGTYHYVVSAQRRVGSSAAVAKEGSFTIGSPCSSSDNAALPVLGKISYWFGKVNQHTDANGAWQTDPDGTSGADLDKITYCKKFYPGTTDIKEASVATLSSWKDAGNSGSYTSIKAVYNCVGSSTVSGNQPPVITGVKSPVSLAVNAQGTWYVSAYDPDGNYLSYSVNWGDAGLAPLYMDAGSSATFQHTYSAAGTYTVTFTVTDDKGATAQSASTVVVGGGSSNLPPVITGAGGPAEISTGSSGTWKVSAYDPDGKYLSYSVLWGDEDSGKLQPASDSTGSAATFQHTYSKAGSYRIVFTVTDSAGAQVKSAVTVKVTGGAATSEVYAAVGAVPTEVNQYDTVYVTGKISRGSPSTNNGAQTYRVVLSFDNGNEIAKTVSAASGTVTSTGSVQTAGQAREEEITLYPGESKEVSAYFTASKIGTNFAKMMVYQKGSDRCAEIDTANGNSEQATRCGNYYTLVASDTTKVYVKESGIPQPPSEGVTIVLQAGWNQISVPASSLLVSDLAQKCDISTNVWYYNAASKQYEKATTLGGGNVGYWVKANSACTYTIDTPYITPATNAFSLKAGWNMIGAPLSATAISNFAGDCKITSGPWNYSPAASQYTYSEKLEPGKGYWVKVASDCTLGTAGDMPPSAPNTEPAQAITPVASATQAVQTGSAAQTAQAVRDVSAN